MLLHKQGYLVHSLLSSLVPGAMKLDTKAFVVQSKRIFCFLLLMPLFLTSNVLAKQNQDWPCLSGPCLGKKSPSSIPKVFAPGLESVEGRYEYGISFSPNFKEVYFSASDAKDEVRVPPSSCTPKLRINIGPRYKKPTSIKAKDRLKCCHMSASLKKANSGFADARAMKIGVGIHGFISPAQDYLLANCRYKKD